MWKIINKENISGSTGYFYQAYSAHFMYNQALRGLSYRVKGLADSCGVIIFALFSVAWSSVTVFACDKP